ncbi:hypothetical protein E2C01_072289 [Portunus trituberculatus]|uniref:Uncharacterized protein n=1 Tax=Portunus trituberculatus TaxID=210409 RepID=A0A5B7I284_PORTR|nr:hypothetical protein [Portunus trituberculatus]
MNTDHHSNLASFSPLATTMSISVIVLCRRGDRCSVFFFFVPFSFSLPVTADPLLMVRLVLCTNFLAMFRKPQVVWCRAKTGDALTSQPPPSPPSTTTTTTTTATVIAAIN